MILYSILQYIGIMSILYISLFYLFRYSTDSALLYIHYASLVPSMDFIPCVYINSIVDDIQHVRVHWDQMSHAFHVSDADDLVSQQHPDADHTFGAIRRRASHDSEE